MVYSDIFMGFLYMAMPGLKTEIHGVEPELVLEWNKGEESEYELFHSVNGGKSILETVIALK